MVIEPGHWNPSPNHGNGIGTECEEEQCKGLGGKYIYKTLRAACEKGDSNFMQR